MRWHRQLIALKWTYAAKRVGRPGLMKAIKALIVRSALVNPSWGYCRIQGELRDVGHRVATTTVANVLKANGVTPAPDRPSSWRTSSKAQWGEVAATDFFTTEVWPGRGLVTYYALFLIALKSRTVHLAGFTTNPDGEFMAQIARNLTDALCLNRMIFFGERRRRDAIVSVLEHHHVERAHQGLGNERVERTQALGTGEVERSERLGGLLKHYRRAA